MRSLLLLCCVAFLFPALRAHAATEIVVYTAAEPELLQLYDKAFRQRHPDIEIKWIRDSGGPVLARIIAEKDAPRAEALFALSLSGVLTLEPLDILQPYTPKDADKLAPIMRSTSPEPLWVAMNAWGAGLCVNSAERERLGLPHPESWADLTDPRYKGHIVMASPVSSSTALFTVNSWLDLMGEDKGWDFMKALDANNKMYVHSGCKPCQMAAQGEAVIGVASGMCIRPLQKKRAPVVLTIPGEGAGWDMEVSALLKSPLSDEHPKRVAARKVMDFTTSEAVGRIAAENGLIPAREDCMDDATRKEQALFLPMDFSKGARERETTLTRWRALFEQR